MPDIVMRLLCSNRGPARPMARPGQTPVCPAEGVIMAQIDVDSNLLFGILAVQNGVIEQSDLIGAIGRWSRERSRPISQMLVDDGTLSEDDRTLIDGLVRRHAAKRGSAVDRCLSAFPAPAVVADCLRQAIELDQDMEESLERFAACRPSDASDRNSLTIGIGSSPPGDDSAQWTYSVGRSSSEGGRFRLVRRHASGGIGMVFLAVDSELHREVALKQMLPQHADDPLSRSRFLIEAEVTGRLEHPGIVPVYGLGTNPQGRPFYAMRFVRGESLKEAIESFHQTDSRGGRDPAERALALRGLLRRFIDVCNAVAYAHSRGVLHRDLKPANVLLGPYGETLVVDWGLAKVVGCDDPVERHTTDRTLRPESQANSSETLVGTVIGTPAYMSPEQAGGLRSQIGPASDVYSLGATLYALLTGKPPQDDPQLEEVLGRTQRGEIVPPRQVNPRVPAALEAVALKAMALKPADRYPSPRALAEEIERWLADEAVQAWPEPLYARARRWMRRRQTPVAVMAVTVLATVLGLAAVLVVQARANAALKVAIFELKLANRLVKGANRNLTKANGRERSRFDLALSAIKAFHTGVSQDFLLKERRFAGLRAKLLATAADFYERLEDLLKGQGDPRSRAALGQAYHEFGELTAKIGSRKEALAALKRGLELRRRLASEPEADRTAKLDLSQTLIAFGDLLEASGDLTGAIASYHEAREILTPLAEDEVDGASFRAAEARCLHRIAKVHFNRGDAAAALAAHEQVRTIRERLAEVEPQTVQFASELADSYHDIGTIHRASGRSALALESYASARRIREKLAERAPAVTELASDLAQSHQHIGFLLHETGRPAEALQSLEVARTILHDLTRANPAVTSFEAELAQCYQTIGSIEDEARHADRAIASFERARAILEKVVEANPTVTLFQTRLAMNHAFVGQVRQREGRPADAAFEFRRAVALVAHVTELQPNGYNLYNHACYLSLLSGVAGQKGSGLTAGEAHSLAAQAVEALRRAAAAGSRDFDFMRRDPDLDPLRSRRDFQLLMMDLAFPDAPFARQ
jgi:tetratricopeptide (TPR) repeat protein/tRNA A-37 threonylcarbamoyl transferase component Bud32